MEKKILLILLTVVLSAGIYSKTVYPVIGLEPLYQTVKGEGEYPKDKLEFRENDKVLKLTVINDKDGELYTLDTYKKNTRILSVFFYDVTGEDTSELIILTAFNNQNTVNVYKLEWPYRENLWKSDIFSHLNLLEKKLNKKFGQTKNLTAPMVKDALNRMYPMDYQGVEAWDTVNDEFKVSKIDFTEGEFLGYFDGDDNKADDKKQADYYIKRWGKNIYARFQKFDSGFSLVSVFEGYEKEGKAVIDGKLVSIGEEEESRAYYKDNVLNGQYEYLYYDGKMSGTYIDGKREGRWVEGNAEGFYINDLKDGKWTDNTEGVTDYYKKDRLLKTEYVDLVTKKIKKEIIELGNYEAVANIYTKNGELEQKIFYKDGELKEGLNYYYFKNSRIPSQFKNIDISKTQYLGEYAASSKFGEPLIFDKSQNKIEYPYRGLKLFSAKGKEKEVFIVMETYPQGTVSGITASYYGVSEIFEGYRKKESIENLADITRNGKFELFYRNYVMGMENNSEELAIKGNYKENKKSGVWEKYLNGLLIEKANYKEDKLHGHYQKFNFPDEYIEEEGEYKNGEKTGEWKKVPEFFLFSE